MKILSNLDTESYAKIGADKYTVSLANVGAYTAKSTSAAANSAYVQNGVVEAKNGLVAVNADLYTNTHPEAESSDVAAGIALVGVAVVLSDSNDVVKAYVTGNSSVTGEQVDIEAVSDADVLVKGGLAKLSISGVDASDVTVIAEAAQGTGGKITHAWIGSGSEVNAIGVTDETAPSPNQVHSLTVKADSTLTVKADIPDSTSFSGLKFGIYYLATKVGKTDTQAYINGKVFSANDITVYAADQVSEEAGTAIMNAAVLGGDVSKVVNSVGTAEIKNKGKDDEYKVIKTTQHTAVGFGDGANVEAYGNIKADAVSKTDVKGHLKENSAAVASDGEMEIETYVYRKTEANVGDNASVKSVIGNIEIHAKEDADGLVEANLIASSISAISEGMPQGSIENNSQVSLSVGGGSLIEAKYGMLELTATAGHKLNASTVRRAAAAVTKNESFATVTDTVNVKVSIAENEAKRTTILGKSTTIGAYIQDQEDRAYALSHTAAAGSRTYAHATLNVNNTVSTVVNNASVGGIEQLKIESIVVSQKLTAQTHAEIIGFTGWVYAYSTINGKNDVSVEITENAEIAGKTIQITADAPKLTKEVIACEADAVANTIVEWVYEKVKHVVKKVVDKVSKIPIIGWIVKKVVEWVEEWVDELVKHVLQSDAKSYPDNSFTNTGSVAFNGLARVGGGAAGIFVDIFDRDVIYSAGTDISLGNDWFSVDRTAGTVSVNRLSNDDAGSFTISCGVGTVSGNGKVESNQYISNMTIVNHSDLNLVLRELILKEKKSERALH